MRAETFLAALRQMPVVAPMHLTGGHPFVVLSPHPDDESLGAGGLIAASCGGGGERVEVVVLTDGSGSHPHSPTYPRDRLVAVRQEEAARATAHLGLPAGHLTHLGLRDAHMPSQGPVFEAAVERVGRLVAEADARSAFVTWDGDPHCDHVAAADLARALRRSSPGLRLWFYPIWGWHLDPAAPVPGGAPQGVRIDITPWMSEKHAAIRAHASQMTNLIDDDPHGFRFTDGTLAPFMGRFEYFFEVPA